MGYRAIGEIFVIEDKELLRVTVTSDTGKSEIIQATPNHPFFVTNVRSSLRLKTSLRSVVASS
jgi:hypothetical protein